MTYFRSNLNHHPLSCPKMGLLYDNITIKPISQVLPLEIGCTRENEPSAARGGRIASSSPSTIQILPGERDLFGRRRPAGRSVLPGDGRTDGSPDRSGASPRSVTFAIWWITSLRSLIHPLP